MKQLLFLCASFLFLVNCTNAIKNSNANVVVEEGTAISATDTDASADEKASIPTKEKLIGSWVGYFEADRSEDFSDKVLVLDEGYVWTRDNKINISIDQIQDSMVIGHSVVAGNDRPFKGSVAKDDEGDFHFSVKEPGDDKYDGIFNFTIKNGLLSGKWQAYKKIEIQNRIYNLELMHFEYNPRIMLDRSKAYVDWHKFVEEKETFEMEGEEVEEWIHREFASATDLIYDINASSDVLSKSLVENLKRGDLTIIRNTIYARHGYSFKHRPLRVFFDAQPWYMPIHTDIKKEFTDLEKQNIQLLLKYEKNAAEYYDSFGRG